MNMMVIVAYQVFDWHHCWMSLRLHMLSFLLAQLENHQIEDGERSCQQQHRKKTKNITRKEGYLHSAADQEQHREKAKKTNRKECLDISGSIQRLCVILTTTPTGPAPSDRIRLLVPWAQAAVTTVPTVYAVTTVDTVTTVSAVATHVPIPRDRYIRSCEANQAFFIHCKNQHLTSAPVAVDRNLWPNRLWYFWRSPESPRKIELHFRVLYCSISQ